MKRNGLGGIEAYHSNTSRDLSNKLVEFEGITNLGMAYTQKTANYSNYTLDLSYCTQLSVESLRSVINNDVEEAISALGGKTTCSN